MQEEDDNLMVRVSASSKVFGFAWELVKIFAVAFFCVVLVKYYLFQPFCVKGASMEETYNNEDYIFIDRIGYRFHEPERLDVIVFRYPLNPSEFFIKRVIGLPGESVEIRSNKTYLYNIEHPNGIALDENAYLTPQQRTSDTPRVVLKEDQYFVMGDNRSHSSDSRFWGPLDKKFITGRVFLTALPQSRFCHLIGKETR